MKVRLLGPIQVLAHGESVDLPVGRQRTLLAALGLARGRALTIEAIAERLWADDRPSDLRGSVATCCCACARPSARTPSNEPPTDTAWRSSPRTSTWSSSDLA